MLLPITRFAINRTWTFLRAVAVLDRAETLIKEAESGKGTVGKLLKDDSLYADVKDGIAEIRAYREIHQGKCHRHPVAGQEHG